MESNILDSFSNLQFELEEAKNCLKNVDENIKKIIGRDPSELPRLTKKRLPLPPVVEQGRPGLKNINRIRKNSYDEAPANKRRNNDKRLSTAIQEDHLDLQKQMISKVIVTSKEIPSREQALEAQKSDEKFKARNKRMFGALLGTLQKFQQEETKLKFREEKRAQLERKIEEHEIKEKEEIKKERHELFLNRKKKQIEIKIIELKILKMKEYSAWVEWQKPRENFIMTKTSPHINYLPRRLNNKTKELLSASKQNIETLIERRGIDISAELKYLEEKLKKNVGNKFGFKSVKSQGTFSTENFNQQNHCSTELITNKSDEDITEKKKIPAEFYSKYDSNNQDKENEDLVNCEDHPPEEILPGNDICNLDINVSKDI